MEKLGKIASAFKKGSEALILCSDEEIAEINFKRHKEEEIICQSAYVPTYSGQSSSYNKYKKSI